MSTAPRLPEKTASAARSALHGGRFLRFLVAGGVNTVFGYLVFLTLIHLIRLDWFALLLTYMIGLTFNFFVFSRYVFTGGIGNIPRYVGSYVIAFVVNFILYSALSAWLPRPEIVQLLCLPPVAVATYLLMHLWGFPGAPSGSDGAQRTGANE